MDERGVLTARVAGAYDLEKIALLQSTDAGLAKQLFGTVDIAAAVETALLSVIVESEGNPLAFAVFNDRIADGDFEAVVHSVQQSLSSSALVSLGNTVAVTNLVLDGSILNSPSGEAAFRTLFQFAASTFLDIDQFILVQPLTSKDKGGLPAVYSSCFMRLPPSLVSGRAVHLMPRSSVIPDLLVRAARVEDHDDLVPVFESRSEVLQHSFGTYFLAEVIERQSKDKKVLVGEGPDGRAVGLLAASNDVDTALLGACFDLAPFGGLVKRTHYQMLTDEREAIKNARIRRDWFSLLSMHSDELQALFDSIVSISPRSRKPQTIARVDGDEVVDVADVMAVFDAKGDAWGYSGVGNLKMGRAMLLDLGFFTASPSSSLETVAEEKEVCDEPLLISRNQLNEAVQSVATRREQSHRRARIAKWYASSFEDTPVGPLPRGRRLVLEEFDRLVAAVEAEAHKRESQAVGLTQPAATVNRSSTESHTTGGDQYSKTEADKHGATGAFAGLFKQVKASQSRRNSTAPDRRASVGAGAPERTTKVPIARLSHAVTSRLAAEGSSYEVPVGDDGSSHVRLQLSIADSAESGFYEHHHKGEHHASVDSVANLDDEKNDAAPGAELLLDLGPLLHQFSEADVAPEGSTASSLPEDAEMISRMTLLHALESWEKVALSTATTPRVLIAAASDRDTRLLPQPIPAAPKTNTVSAAIATIVAEWLQIPCTSVAEVLMDAVADHRTAVAAAHAAAIAAAEEEERRKKEAEDAAKKKKKPAADKKTASTSSTTHHAEGDAARAPTDYVVIDPAVDAAGAIAQQLTKPKYAKGFVMSGVPTNDDTARCLHNALENAGVHASAVLYAWDEIENDGHDTLHAHTSHRQLVHKPSERLLLHAAAAVNDGDSASKPVNMPSSVRRYGPTILLEGHVAKLTKQHQKLQGVGVVHTGRMEPHSNKHAELSSVAIDALKEHILAALLHEGVIQADPYEQAFLKARREVKHTGETPASNAFSITLFCLSSEYEARFMDLLAGAFEAFPDREYCILTQPHTAPDVPILRRFVPASHSASSTLDQTLHICHRDSLASPSLIAVRRSTANDRLALLNMVSPLPDGAVFMDSVIAADAQARLPLSHDASCAIASESVGKSIPRVVTFVAELDKQIVCAAVLSLTGCTMDAVEAAAQSFDLEQFINPALYGPKTSATGSSIEKPVSSFASLLHIVCNPCFLQSVPFFLRQCMRLYFGRTGLFYRQASSPYGPHIASPLPPPLKYAAMLVSPRVLPELNPRQLLERLTGRDQLLAELDRTQASYDHPLGVVAAMSTVAGLHEMQLSDPRMLDHALYVCTPALSLQPPLVVNTRIVIIGASDAALSCSFSLLGSANIKLPHITIVSPGGLPQPFDYIAPTASFVSGREYSAFELSRMPISSFVRLVDDVVVRISRSDKSLELSSGSSIRYDYLILLPGLTEPTWSRLGYASPDELPLGMHCLLHANSLGQLAADVDALVESAGDSPLADPVLVYGDSLDAIVSINALIERGIRSSDIAFVAPCRKAGPSSGAERSLSALLPGSEISTPAAYFVEKTISARLQHLGVKVMHGYELVGLQEAAVDDIETGEAAPEEGVPQPMIARFQPLSDIADRSEQKHAEEINISASLLICADTRDVDPRLYQAVNDCGIVYDGRLVVDHEFRATDASIFGGGSVAKFSRRYRAPHFLQHYDSREGGALVATSVLRVVDPLYTSGGALSPRQSAAAPTGVSSTGVLPKFFRPKSSKALLPSRLHLLRVRLPEYDLGDSGRELVSGMHLNEIGLPEKFMRLQLDRFDRIVELEYAGIEAVEVHNLASIVGRQADLLNGLIRKHGDGMVDIVDFLRGDWGPALFHDRFDSLIVAMRSSLVHDSHVAKLLKDIEHAIMEDGPDEAMQRIRHGGVGIVGEKLPAATRKKIEMQLLSFLRAQRRVLSTYFIPNTNLK